MDDGGGTEPDSSVTVEVMPHPLYPDNPNNEYLYDVQPDLGPATITVTPDSREELSITLAPAADGAVCTADGQTLSNGLATLMPGPGPETQTQEAQAPLTASFKGVPAAHDGERAFTFALTFSEDVAGLSFKTLRDQAFSVTNGQVTRARRQTQGTNQGWTITVEPDSPAAVTVTLPAGSVETADGFGLESAVSATVAGPSDDAPEPNTAAAGVPTISGTPQVGEALTVSTSGISDADGLDTARFAYQWIRGNTDIQDATDSSYTLVSVDEGETIKVRVTFSDDKGHEESLTSAATDAVAPAVGKQSGLDDHGQAGLKRGGDDPFAGDDRLRCERGHLHGRRPGAVALAVGEGRRSGGDLGGGRAG